MLQGLGTEYVKLIADPQGSASGILKTLNQNSKNIKPLRANKKDLLTKVSVLP